MSTTKSSWLLLSWGHFQVQMDGKVLEVATIIFTITVRNLGIAVVFNDVYVHVKLNKELCRLE